ncbi:hypothetical protein TNCV_475891 [Trichonephila clavipes]|nr:hypothetical protein TNCV_475891 [Trichonephila clavipes]
MIPCSLLQQLYRKKAYHSYNLYKRGLSPSRRNSQFSDLYRIALFTPFFAQCKFYRKLVVNVQSILYYLEDCDILFSEVQGHSGNLCNNRMNQLAIEATSQDMDIFMFVPLSHWKHLAWEKTVSTWNTELFASPNVFDEAHFWLNGYVNKRNCRIWSEAYPQVYVETPLHPEKLTVWCALWAGGILLQKR